MKLPPRIKLGAHTWRFGWHEGPQEIGQKTPRDCWGLCHHDHLKITFERGLKKQPPTYAAEVVLHEVAHAVHHTFGVVDGLDEEDVTERAARGWLQVIADNPQFVAYVRDLAATPDENDDEPDHGGPDPVLCPQPSV